MDTPLDRRHWRRGYKKCGNKISSRGRLVERDSLDEDDWTDGPAGFCDGDEAELGETASREDCIDACDDAGYEAMTWDTIRGVLLLHRGVVRLRRGVRRGGRGRVVLVRREGRVRARRDVRERVRRGGM